MADAGIEFHYAARSDIGLKRSSNQDSAYAGANLLVLADGMGGAAGGDIASSVAIAHLAPLDFESHSAEDLLPLLHNAFQNAHDELGRLAAENPELMGLGTTCIAILRAGKKLAMAHIGDSRAYVLRDQTLAQVTTDHSFVQFLISQGEITPEEAQDHPQRNAVTKVLGYDEDQVEPDETVREAVLNDRWLLCSDGVSGLISDDTIAHVLASISDPGECAEELISLALRAGGTDNATCIVADIVPAGSTQIAAPQVVGAASQERFSPSRLGSSAAAKAAQLNAPEVQPEVGAPAPARPVAPSHPWRTSIISLLVVLTVGVGTWLGYAWTQTRFYITGVSGTIVVYQGIPQNIGPWELSTLIDTTDIQLKSLDDATQKRYSDPSPVTVGSREEVDKIIADLRGKVAAQKKAADSAQSGDAPQSGDKPQSGDMPQSGVQPADSSQSGAPKVNASGTTGGR